MIAVETIGQGRDIVALHGWGMNRDIWQGVASRLNGCRLHLVDLPGYGQSKDVHADSIEAIVAQIADAVPAGSVWMGWSLGGIIAQAAVASGVAISKLILVDSTASFIKRAEWQNAMEPEILNGFALQLADDFRATLQKFMALQARGSEKLKDEIRLLRDTVLKYGDPDQKALKLGLTILKQADYRQQLSRISQPTLLIHGNIDHLIPITAVYEMATQIPNAQIREIDRAGHAPFLSHPQPFIEAVETFVHES